MYIHARFSKLSCIYVRRITTWNILFVETYESTYTYLFFQIILYIYTKNHCLKHTPASVHLVRLARGGFSPTSKFGQLHTRTSMIDSQRTSLESHPVFSYAEYPSLHHFHAVHPDATFGKNAPSPGDVCVVCIFFFRLTGHRTAKDN